MKVAASILIVVCLAGLYWVLSATGVLTLIMDSAGLVARVRDLGLWGPLVIIGTMTLAVVMSPIPSAPIALAAGAAYGHIWGTVYVLIGAETGAIIAFWIARYLGIDVMHRWFGDRLKIGFWGSQSWLMTIVLTSRLLPFISFDLVSYAAGLTTLAFWRFALATLAGTLPSSFLLAHFGGEMSSADPTRIGIAVVLLGVMTFVTFGMHWLSERRRDLTAEDLKAGQND